MVYPNPPGTTVHPFRFLPVGSVIRSVVYFLRLVFSPRTDWRSSATVIIQPVHFVMNVLSLSLHNPVFWQTWAYHIAYNAPCKVLTRRAPDIKDPPPQRRKTKITFDIILNFAATTISHNHAVQCTCSPGDHDPLSVRCVGGPFRRSHKGSLLLLALAINYSI